ncbi:HAD family hydrolase [Photobacterium halotolerans]|uniref:HAD family hydrolase n=1 Tax=Photobacterium halotolerans TaxID=265726 RepID=UPI0004052B97|nr:HAD family phosphatase [Photobacterium halotolerans]
MIHNVVFDFGAVLFDWNPHKIVSTFTQSTYEQDMLLTHVLQHPDWLALDRGTMLMAEVIPKFAARTGFPEARMEDFIDHIQNSLTVIDASKHLLEDLLEQDFNLYYLTNMSSAFFDTLNDKHDFISLFNGGLVSAKELLMKPEPEIFQSLMLKYSLSPDDTYFIDDNEDNVLAARKLGITAIRFSPTPDCYQQIRSALRLKVD